MNALECAEKAEEIFVLSDSFNRIRELIDDDSSTIDNIADVIILDPTLSVTILKLANSSFFNYPGKIDTISKAVLILGITEVYNLVIAYFTTDAFKNISAKPDYLEEFWEQAIDCALIIKFLGQEANIPNAERLFILGLLHNVGELVVYQSMPQKISLCNKVTASEFPWEKQQSILNFTYADCSTEILKQWNLPYNLIAPIKDQDVYYNENDTLESKLLYLSKRVMLLTHQCRRHKPSSLISSSILEDLNITPKMIRAANDFCNIERFSILSILSPSSSVIY